MIRIPKDYGNIDLVELTNNKVLITSGCSFANKGKDGVKPWSEFLSEKTNRTLLDWSKWGSSNEYICRVVLDSVLENINNDILVVVGWTLIGRDETFTKDDADNCDFETDMLNDPRKATNLNVDRLYNEKYEQYTLNHTYFQEHLKKLNTIILLGNFLHNNNIKYIFFNANDLLSGWKTNTGYYKKSESGKDCKVLNRATDYIKDNLNFLNKVQISIGANKDYEYDVICGNYNHPGLNKETNPKFFVNDGWHPSEYAHEEWSKVLYDEICNRY